MSINNNNFGDRQLTVFSDLDDTLVSHAHKEPQEIFKKFYLKNFLLSPNIKLAYNTGRGLTEFLSLKKEHNLLFPDFIIVGAGTYIIDCSDYSEDSDKLYLQHNQAYDDHVS